MWVGRMFSEFVKWTKREDFFLTLSSGFSVTALAQEAIFCLAISSLVLLCCKSWAGVRVGSGFAFSMSSASVKTVQTLSLTNFKFRVFLQTQERTACDFQMKCWRIAWNLFCSTFGFFRHCLFFLNIHGLKNNAFFAFYGQKSSPLLKWKHQTSFPRKNSLKKAWPVVSVFQESCFPIPAQHGAFPTVHTESPTYHPQLLPSFFSFCVQCHCQEVQWGTCSLVLSWQSIRSQLLQLGCQCHLCSWKTENEKSFSCFVKRG